MLALNRSAIVVRPTSPLLDWLDADDPTLAHAVSLTREPTIYSSIRATISTLA
jgi:hypothetical protein